MDSCASAYNKVALKIYFNFILILAYGHILVIITFPGKPSAQLKRDWRKRPGNTKGGSITVPLTGLEKWVLQTKTKIVSCHTADSKPVKLEVNGTVILPPSVFPEETNATLCCLKFLKYIALFGTGY
jgi:hypothetical protein